MKHLHPEPGKRFYLYHYIDPRTGHVRYVGIGSYTKGKGVRCYRHWSEVKTGGKCGNRHLSALLKTLLDLGLQPTIVVVEWFATVEESRVAEIEHISRYGRRVDGGRLCNFTLGGEGAHGHHQVHSVTTRAALGARTKAKWQDPEYRAKRAVSQREFIENNPDAIAAQAAKTRLAWTDEKKLKHGAAMAALGNGPKISAALKASDAFQTGAVERAKALSARPDVVAKRAATLKATMNTPEMRAKLSATAKTAMATPEAKANKSAAMKLLWQDPAYVAKMRARKTRGEKQNPA